jgi:hypothetical protein
VVKYAHSKGLLFGLYFETEGGRDGTMKKRPDSATIEPWKNSKVHQEHPEWFRYMNFWFTPNPEKPAPPRPVLNLAIPEAAAYFEEELERIIKHYQLDLYRHDFNAPHRGQASETLRDGFIECDYWRHYEAFHGIISRLRRKYPDVIFQQASAGGFRNDMATIGVFHEHFASDRASYPSVYRMLAGMSVFLPPEIIANSTGLAMPMHLPDLLTSLREIYAMGTTPMVFSSILPKCVEELPADKLAQYRRYAKLYQSFMRPMLGATKVYHHAPVNAEGGVESSDWFVMEFAARDCAKAWATVVQLAPEPPFPYHEVVFEHKHEDDSFAPNAPGAYRFKPRGLDTERDYAVTLDNSGKTERIRGSVLMRQGVEVHTRPDCRSELILMEAMQPS